MDIRIFDSEDEQASHAATWCAGAISRALRERECATIVLTPEASQIPFLTQLSSRHVDWSRVTCFLLSQLTGLERYDDRNYSQVLRTIFCDHVQPSLKEYLPLITKDDIAKYGNMLESTEVDLVCMGLGDDGSVGFNQPGSDLCQQHLTEVELAAPLKRQLMREGGYESVAAVPGRGLTLSLSVLQRARSISVLVPDFNQAEAVHATLLGPVGIGCPGSLFRGHQHGVFWLNYHSAMSYLRKVKAKEQYATVKIPGLVDLQVMGYNGVDFHDPSLSEETFRNSCREILATGLAVFLPTLITSPMSVYERNLPLIARVIQEEEFRLRIPGIHLDGPFISNDPGVSCCHHGTDILPADPATLDHLIRLCGGKLLLFTMAADVPGAVELANYASAQGVKISLGHQMANSVDVRHMVRMGAKMLTHFGNGLPEMIDRHNNPVWPALVEDNLMAAIITDGHHLSNDIIQAVLRVKGPDNTLVTSDMTSVTGLAPGRYKLFHGVNIILENNNAVYLESGEWFAGSAMTALQCANYLLKQDIVDIPTIQKLCFHNPLKLLGIDPQPILASVQPRLTVKRGALELVEPDEEY